MSSSAEQIANDGADAVIESGGLAAFFREYGVGGIGYAIILGIISAISAAGDLLLAPWRELADGLAGIVGGTLGVGVDIISAGGGTAIQSIETGLASILGPFAFPFAVAIVMLAVYVFIAFVTRIELSPRVFISNLRP